MPRHNRAPEAQDSSHSRDDWRVLGTLLPYLKEFPLNVVFALSCLLLAKVAGVTLPLVLKHIVDRLDAPTPGLVTVPLALLLAYGFMRFISVLMGELRDVFFGRVSERAMRLAALRVFRHLHRLDLDFHLSRRTGGLSRDIERGISGISFLLRFMLFNIVPTLLEIGMVAAILLFNYGVVFAVLTLCAVSVYILFSILTTEWRTGFVREANRLDTRANTRAIDSLLNYETVKYFGNESHEAYEYDRFLEESERARQHARKSLGALNAGQAVIIAVSLTLMMILAARRVAGGVMTIGDFVAINAYIIQLFIPLNFLGFVYREIRRAVTDASRMFQLLEQQPAVADAADATPLQWRGGTIRFEDVCFSYANGRKIIRGLSFEIPAGRKLAVVGPSGAGKSTLARLLYRFYDPQHGRILIDGQPLTAVTQDSLRAVIGVVPQDTVLFNDTLYYNLQYGRPTATRAEVENAVRAAHLQQFIEQLPDGYETQVGERGLKLSGGEKQRVAIARALLKAPGILIFDEATSSLDSASEQAILEALKELASEHTTLVIAHRLSTITDADDILLLEHGRIAERGTHAELLALDRGYAHLWRLQQREGGSVTLLQDPLPSPANLQ